MATGHCQTKFENVRGEGCLGSIKALSNLSVYPQMHTTPECWSQFYEENCKVVEDQSWIARSLHQ